MKLTNYIPNFLTFTNLFLGCLAIVYIVQDNIYINLSDESEEGVRYISALGLGKLPIACILILVAAVIDLLDGYFARLFNAESRIGQQLDSLADLVTFGLVPGLIMYHLLAISWFGSANTFSTPVLLFLPAFAITLAAAWRLARFNVLLFFDEADALFGKRAEVKDSHDRYANTSNFKGLPTPAAAIVVASLPLAAHLSESGFDKWIAEKWVMYGITLMLTLLMISRLPMAKIGSGHATWIFIAICALIMLVGRIAFGVFFSIVPSLVVLYVLYSLVISSSNRKSEIVNRKS